MNTTTITLDICTPEGKTWLARITGLGGKYGVEREFINAVRRDTTRSGKTGTATYEVEDGPYETQEARHRLGRRYVVVRGGEATEVESAKAALDAFGGGPSGLAHDTTAP